MASEATFIVEENYLTIIDTNKIELMVFTSPTD